MKIDYPLVLIMLAVVCISTAVVFLSESAEGSCNDYSVILQDRILMAQDHLREDNPDAEEGCIITASYIQLGLADQVAHMMQPFGRCATEVLGMRNTVRWDGSSINDPEGEPTK